MYTMYMALHITNPDVEREVRETARERGQSITDLIGTAVRQLRCKGQEPVKRRPTVAEMLTLIHSFPKTSIDYSRSEDEILGYGPDGY